jgi:MYXO-CTERM domain-containing protein
MTRRILFPLALSAASCAPEREIAGEAPLGADARIFATPTADLVANGGDAGVSLGTGDFDGDGYGDLLVGSNTSGLFAPAVTTFYGGPGGLTSAAADLQSEGTPGEYWGGDVAGAGDVNGDGVDDVVIGAGNGSYATFHPGGVGGWSAPGVRLDGVPGSGFGTSVAGIGDVNGDGLADVGITAPAQYLPGALYVFEGGPGGLAAVADTTLLGTTPGDVYGYQVAGLGDVDGDGFDDVALSSLNPQVVEIHAGSAGGLTLAAVTTLSPPVAGGLFGYLIAAGGDIDGDGSPDLLVADPFDDTNGNDTGAVYGYRGGPGGFSTTPDWTMRGTQADGYFGFSLHGVGDTDADGFDDVAIGAYAANASMGELTFLSGSALGPIVDRVIPGTLAQQNLGYAIDGADFDADGLSDVAASAYALGRVLVFRGVIDDDDDGFDTDVDCNDGNPAVHPGAVEVCNGLDDDCSGDVDADAIDATDWYADADSDGFGAGPPIHACVVDDAVADDTDCDDTNAGINPVADEVCNGEDDNCDLVTDTDAIDRPTWFADTDLDGFGDALAPTAACTAPGGSVADATDCDDTSGAIHPGAAELCNGLDDDCDLSLDEDATDLVTFYADLDGDGFGDPAASVTACAAPPDHVTDPTDCDDGDETRFPGATEVTADEVDSDCDGGEICYADADADGHRPGDVEVGSADSTCTGTGEAGAGAPDDDCDDTDATIHGGADEVLDDGIDQDCDGSDLATEDPPVEDPPAETEEDDVGGCGCTSAPAAASGAPLALLCVALGAVRRRRT